MKLNIKQSSWSGWSKDYKPEETEKQYDIKTNEKYIIKTRKISYIENGEMVEREQEIFSFEITEINSENIKIRTFQQFSGNDINTINIISNKTEFEIAMNKTLKLVTPTLDYGDIFILTLIK